MPAVDTARLVAVFLVGAVTALALTPLMRRLALRLGWVAVPVGRSVHRVPVPYLGGVAIFAGYAAALLAGIGADHPLFGVLLAGAAATVLLGAVDDVRNLSPGLKLAGMVLIGVGTALTGVRIEWVTNPFGGLLHVPDWLGIALTAFWIVALMNVMNLIDGLDGLAAGIAAIASVTLLLAALKYPLPAVSSIGSLLSTALLGSTLGFLPYNFNPARIFMGDAGSLLLGYALAVTSVEGALKGAAAFALAVPVLALGLPIADTALSIVRRWREHRPIGQADRGHLHHRLLDMGLSHREAVVVMYLFSGWLGVGALALSDLGPVQSTLILTLVVATMYFGIKKVGIGSGGGKTRSGPTGVA